MGDHRAVIPPLERCQVIESIHAWAGNGLATHTEGGAASGRNPLESISIWVLAYLCSKTRGTKKSHIGAALLCQKASDTHSCPCCWWPKPAQLLLHGTRQVPCPPGSLSSLLPPQGFSPPVLEELDEFWMLLLQFCPLISQSRHREWMDPFFHEWSDVSIPRHL